MATLPCDDAAVVFARIKSYKPDKKSGFTTIITPPLKNSSEIYKYGVMVSTSAGDQYRWYCLAHKECQAGGVYQTAGGNKSSSNPMKHLRKYHGIVSSRTTKMSAKKERREGKVNDLRSSKLFMEDPTRGMELALAFMVILTMVATSLVEHEGFRFMLAIISTESMNLECHAKLINHRIVEIYNCLLKTMSEMIQEDLKDSPIPMINLLVDEWYCKLLRQRFIGIRIRYVTRDGSFVSLLLSVRHYRRVRAPSEVARASEILLEWTKRILQEFNISPSMIFSATTDAGPDVRCMAETLLPNTQYDWCVCHLLAKAVQEACGMIKGQKTQLEVKLIITSINAMIARIQNSKTASAAFEKIIISAKGKGIQLKKYLEIRFVGVVRCLERVLELWECLEELYVEFYINDEFPVPASKEEVEQLYALFYGIREIQQHAQTRDYPVSCTVLLMLMSFHNEVLGPDCDITYGNKIILARNATPILQTARSALLEALNKRFYDKYRVFLTGDVVRGSGKPAADDLLAQVAVMHPAFNKLTLLDSVIEARNKARRGRDAFQATGKTLDEIKSEYKTKIHNKILALAVQVAKHEPDLCRQLEYLDIEEEPDPLADVLPSVNSNYRRDQCPAEQRARNELNSYLQMHCPSLVSRNSQKNVMQWWLQHRDKFPILFQVARALLGSEASSAAVELDFGLGSMYYKKDRLSTDPRMVEMKLMVNRNRNWMDWNSYTEIQNTNLDAHKPSLDERGPFAEQLSVDEEEEHNLVDCFLV